MIIVDFSQIIISNIMVSEHKADEIPIDLFRMMVIRKLLNIKEQFRGYGEFVLALDSKQSWRKEVFPVYKANRETNREKSDLDWNEIFSKFALLIKELKLYTNWKMLNVDRAEADDIIAVLADITYRRGERTVIISGDKDFIQLQKYSNISQYDPIRKIEKLPQESWYKDLMLLVLNGDKSDGVPNVLSDANSFVINKRQTALTKKRIEKWFVDGLEQNYEKVMGKEIYERFLQNKLLIDLTSLPVELYYEIQAAYEKPVENKGYQKINDFLALHQLYGFTERIGEFL